MRLCRYNNDRLGVVRDGQVFDATSALDALPALRWPLPLGDALIANLDALRPAIEAAASGAAPLALGDVTLNSPVANPSKVIAAPVNYHKHAEEARADAEINYGRDIKTIDHYGLFLKSNSSIVGPDEGVAIRFADRRNDHEVELVVVIGKGGSDIAREDAMSHIAGYTVGLDMSVRGTEDRSLRKSLDTFTVLGPWLVTADEIADPGNLNLSVSVNEEMRQDSNTSYLIFDIPKLITYASAFCALHPGDIIMTGTPEGVAPVVAGDTMVAKIDQIGEMTVPVRAHKA